MYHYKKIKGDGTLDSLQSCSNNVEMCDASLVPISEEEFNELSAELNSKLEAEERLVFESLLAEQERINNLEKENAELLFRVLTGEDLTDV